MKKRHAERIAEIERGTGYKKKEEIDYDFN